MRVLIPVPITETAFVESSAGAMLSSSTSETVYPNWVSFAKYKKGQRVLYVATVYECVRGHRKRVTTPDNDTRNWQVAALGTTLGGWNAATNYAVGDRVSYSVTHRNYQALTAGVDATRPDQNATKWVDIGPTNSWAMFDNANSTRTQAASPLTTSIKPGPVTAAAVLGIAGASTVRIQMVDPIEGSVYDTTVSVGDSQALANWWDYFFLPVITTTDFVLTNLPPYGQATITMTVTGVDKVGIGVWAVGNVVDFAPTNMNPQLGIVDYSVKDTDPYGNITVVERAFADKIEVDCYIDNHRLDYLKSMLNDLRATPVVWFDETSSYQSLIVYGFYKDFNIAISYPLQSLCSLSIEGLT